VLIPEAILVREGSTARSATAAIAGLARWMPIPATIRPGSSAVRPSVLAPDQRERRREQPAPPIPAARAMSSTAMFQARPQSSDTVLNTSTPSMKTSRRP